MKFKTLKSKLALTGYATMGALLASNANAAVDVASIVTEISSNEASIVSVGGAALLLTVAAVMFKYIRRAL